MDWEQMHASDQKSGADSLTSEHAAEQVSFREQREQQQQMFQQQLEEQQRMYQQQMAEIERQQELQRQQAQQQGQNLQAGQPGMGQPGVNSQWPQPPARTSTMYQPPVRTSTMYQPPMGQQPYGQQTYGQQTSGKFDAYDDGVATNYERIKAYQRVPSKCPGKEIVALVLGIHSIVFAGLGLLFFWLPSFAIVYAVMSFIIAGVTFYMHYLVMLQAEITTKKVHIAKVLAIIGIALGVITLIATIAFQAAFGSRFYTNRYTTQPTYTYYSF